MQPEYVHPKLRKTYGRQCFFSDKHKIQLSIAPNLIERKNFILKNPVDKSTQLSREYAESDANTIRKVVCHKGMLHVQGGWPKDVNYLDEEQPVRYKRKLEKEDNYIKQVTKLVGKAERLVLQNSSVNIYEQYYSHLEDMEPPPAPMLEQVQTFTEPNQTKRPIRYISFSMDDNSHVALAHADLDENSCTDSYIWNCDNPIAPVAVLKPEHQILSLEFHPKDPPILASSLLNGQVAIWDFRIPKDPIATSLLEVSHRAPANGALWVNSKSGKEFFSGSADGQILFWDYRDLREPIDKLLMDPVRTDDQNLVRAQGISVLEYETTIPTKFMVGTQEGLLFSCNRKGKSPLEKINFKLNCHYGPVLGLTRNPSFLKTFLSVGDWNARIWSEDNRDNPISWTKNHPAPLTSGCWSVNRCSLFFVSRTDGVLEAWDYLQQQDQALVSLKVSDCPIRSIRSHINSEIVACGSEIGSLHFVRVSKDLVASDKSDKGYLTAMMDRESKREKIISDKAREWKLKLRTMDQPKEDTEPTSSEIDAKMKEEEAIKIEQAQKEFYGVVEKERARKKKEYLGVEDKDESGETLNESKPSVSFQT